MERMHGETIKKLQTVFTQAPRRVMSRVLLHNSFLKGKRLKFGDDFFAPGDLCSNAINITRRSVNKYRVMAPDHVCSLIIGIEDRPILIRTIATHTQKRKKATENLTRLSPSKNLLPYKQILYH